MFVLFFELFADMGIGTAVIQRYNLSTQEASRIFGFTCILGIVLGGIFCLVFMVISNLYGDKHYLYLGTMFSIVVMLTAINVVPEALVMKRKKFAYASCRMIISCIVSYAIAIFLAYNQFGYYALVIRSMIMVFMQLFLNTCYIKILPSFNNMLGIIKEIFSYSFYQFAASLISYVQRNLDNVLVKKYLGDASLGYYDKAYSLTRYPVSYLSNVITPVLHPVLAEHQKEKEYLFEQYMRILRMISLLGVLVVAILLSSSSEIILILYGEQWVTAITPLRVMCYCIWPQMLTGTVGCILQSLGNTKTLFKICCSSVVVSVIGILIGISTRTLGGLALAVTAIYWIHFIIYFVIVMRVGFGYKFAIFWKSIYKDIISLLIMFIPAGILSMDEVVSNLFLSLILKTFLIILVFMITMVTVNREHPVMGILRQMIDQRNKL